MLYAVGPVLDPLDEEVIHARDVQILPVVRHIGGALDMWFPQWVNMQNSGAGIELFDPLYISTDGFSWGQIHYQLEQLDITDPAYSGRPLIDIPPDTWQTLHVSALFTDLPGIAWQILPPKNATTTAHAHISTGGEVGGGLWLPAQFMDREPSFSAGAPTTRRALTQAKELSGSATWQAPTGPVRLMAEYLQHQHRYLTLFDKHGAYMPDTAKRATVMLAAAQTWADRPYDITLAYQTRDRDHDGAQFRYPQGLTQNITGEAFVAQIATHTALFEHQQLAVRLGYGYRHDTATTYQTTPLVYDINQDLSWMANPRSAEDASRMRLDGRAVLTLGTTEDPLVLEARAGVTSMQLTPHIVGNRIGTTYNTAPLSQTVYAPFHSSTVYTTTARLGVDFTTHVSDLSLKTVLAVDHAAVYPPQADLRVSFLSPAAGISLQMPLSQFKTDNFFVLLRHEPEALTSELARFVNGSLPTGSRYAWLDDGDGIPQANETGDLQSYTGGFTHVLGSIVRPTSNHIAVGYKTVPIGPLFMVMRGVGRFLVNPFTVTNTETTAATRTLFHDPGGGPGGNRGEVPAPGGGQLLPVYAMNQNDTSHAGYALTTSSKIAHYLGLELNIVSNPGRDWFINAGGAAYLSAGAAPFGNYPDNNDPGVIAESSADLNAALNSYGRYDHDRAFALKIMTGVIPMEDLTLSLAARYRDGQPFTRVVIDTDLPQGPVALMALRRGKVRYTFHMDWDVRLRYDLHLGPVNGALIVDVLNVFGSATELLEDVRTGESYRRALEAVPDRALLVSLELDFDHQRPSRAAVF